MGLPAFSTVRGTAAYFFLPGKLKALRYLAARFIPMAARIRTEKLNSGRI